MLHTGVRYFAIYCRITFNLLAPDLPRTEVFDPTLTTSLPVIVPEMITTLAVLPVTALLRAARVVTVTGDAEPPPVVL